MKIEKEEKIRYHFNNPNLFVIFVFSIGIFGFIMGKYDSILNEFLTILALLGWGGLAIIILSFTIPEDDD